jgi:hypothetical protein
MKSNKSYDFTNVKIGDKVITELQFYPYPKMYTRSVMHVTKTTFTVENYATPPGPGKVYKKVDGVPYPRDRMTSNAIVWTQEIQSEYDAFVTERNDCSRLKGEIGSLSESLVQIVKYQTDSANLSFIKNTMEQAVAEINNLVVKLEES